MWIVDYRLHVRRSTVEGKGNEEAHNCSYGDFGIEEKRGEKNR